MTYSRAERRAVARARRPLVMVERMVGIVSVVCRWCGGVVKGCVEWCEAGLEEFKFAVWRRLQMLDSPLLWY